MAGPFRSTVCPHDCPSTCALEVEVLDRARIGAVRGAADNTYTAGVICAKVARYAERVHHPGRLLRPLIRTGRKGDGAFREAGWEEALDRVAGALTDAAARHGPEAVWPYHFAGTMGLVQRDGINRLRHVMGYSQQHNTICSTACESGWVAGVGRYGGPNPREMAEADLIVMWGGNPVSTQVNVMTHVSRARKERGAKFAVVDPYRTPSAAAADLHLAPRPGTDGALACAVMHVMFRDGTADRAYMAEYADCPDRLEAHLRDRGPEWAAGITGLTVAEIEGFAALYGRTDRAFLRVAPPRRRRLLEQPRQRHLPLGQDADRGPGRTRPRHPAHGHEPDRRRAGRRPGGTSRRPARHGPVYPKHQPRRRGARQQPGAPGLPAGRPVRLRA